ncbi:phosphotyrosine protein phosphatase [Litchfieldella qijiaojingensis]|uniref:Phosphotyrosine protein phosphatase n=2 Tax=Litchfieldella qijiaojingensis TaxID=980347 RepID=A0ABQ2Z7Y2_9GAMM|nr:phosphotyrosine protein phosphatase [Halomonas qijiaojingensis]
MKLRLPTHSIESAGLSMNVMEGQGIPAIAQELAKKEGLDLSKHRSRCIQREMIESADLVLVMSESQRLSIGELSPEATGKTMLFGRWLRGGGAQGMEIPDPYRKSREAYAHVHRLLVKAADEWQVRLT